MNEPKLFSAARVPARVTAAYACGAAAWIVLSDLAGAMAFGGATPELWTNIAKGLLFVGVSAGLLYVLLRRNLAREEAVRGDLEASQERFNSAVAQLPFTFAIYDGERRFRFLNTRGLLAAHKPLEEVLGRRDEEVFPLEMVNAYLPVLTRALEQRQPQTEVVDILLPAGHVHVAYTFTPLLQADGTVREVLAVANDMTVVVRNDRRVRRLNRTLQAISAANSVLVRSTDEADLLRAFCETLIGPTGHRLAWVGLVTSGDPVVRVAAQAGVAGEYLNGIEVRWDDTAAGGGPTGMVIRTGELSVCHDFLTDARMVPWRERAAHAGLRSSVALPLRTAGGMLGALTLYSGEPNRFDEEEVRLLVELADDLAFGIAAMRRQFELQRTTEQLRESEEQLRTLKQVIDQSPSVAYVARAEAGWPMEFISENIGRFGYQARDFVEGKIRFPAIVHPEDLADLVKAVDKAVAGGKSELTVEYRLLDKRGQVRWVQDYCMVVRNAAGTATHFRGVFTDVTQQRRTSEVLANTYSRYHGLLEQAVDGIVLVDVTGRFVEANPAACSLYGRPLEDLHELNLADTYAPEERPLLPERLAAARDGATFRTERQIARPDGTKVDVEVSWGPVEGILVQGMLRDVTERKRADEELRWKTAFFEAQVDSALDGILVVDARGKKILQNRRFNELWKFPADIAAEKDDRRQREYAISQTRNPQEFAERVDWLYAHPEEVSREEVELVDGTVLDRYSSPVVGPGGRHYGRIWAFRDVTERRRAETLLRESQERLARERALLRTLLDSIPDLIFFKDKHSVYLGCNRAFEIYSGMPEGELVGKTDLDFAPREAAEFYRKKDQEMLAAGAPVRTEEWIPFKEGGGGQFDTLKTPYYGPGGEMLGLIGISRNVTERQRAEAQTRDALAYLGTLIEASPVAIVSYDETGQAQTANEAAARIVGGSLDQVLAQNFRQLESWRGSGMLAAAERALERRGPELLEARVRTTYGNDVWLSMQFVPFQRSNAWHLLLLMADVSEQTRTNAQLRLQSAALEAAANAIVITDVTGTIQWANPALTKATGYPLEEVVGKNPRLLKSGKHPRAFYEGMWKTILAGRNWRGEMCNRRKDGTLYDEEMTIAPVRDPAGQVTHFIAIKQDITERKSLERQFLRAQRMEGIGLLAGGIAHDLNNVLAPILMGADLLKMQTKDDQIAHQLESIVLSARRGAEIVKQVLTFARGIEGERVTLQVKHVLKEMVRMVRETFPRNIQFRVDVPNDLWPVIGDPTQLHQVLLNLSVNARDAMPDGGELAYSARNTEVDAKLAQANPGAKPGPHVRLSVQDNGSGIPPEVLDRIFEPFFTTKELGKGTGLGLSTVLGILRSHGGFVTVESQPGLGTTFAVYIPASPDAASSLPADRPEPLPLGEGELVLVVDDEADILQVTRSMLERHGYRVLAASDGTFALTELSKHLGEVKVVVTDIMMPYMDGVQLIHAVRRLAPGVKIIASSGALGMPGQRDRTDEVLALGVKHILHKPYPVEALLRTVHAELHPEEKRA